MTKKISSSLKFKNKLKKYIHEGFSQKQALAMTYAYFKKNPESPEKHKVDWIKEPLSEEDFKTLTDYYSNKFVAAKIRWFDEKSGEGFVRLSEGPLKGFSVFVHGSAFGGDQNFGQETAFKATDDLPVLVKLILDWNYIQVHRMKEDKGIKKNPDSNRAVAAKIRNPRRVEDINMSQFLFCYGSNNIDQLKERLGHEIKAFPAFISGYRRAFRGYSERWQGGVATLIKKEGHTYGLAIKVNDHDIKKLDKYEGYPTYYTRKNLKVNVDGKIETCVVYLSNSKEQNDPSKAYLKAIYKTVSTFWDVNSPNDFYNKNPESKKCIFQTPVQMRDFLNKHLKDRWSWRKNEIVVQAGQANWKIARAVEDFFTLAGFAGAGSEMDNIGNVVVRAYVPKSIMALKDKE